MLQDDQTLADEVTLMARAHFNKLASLAVRVQGARELGIVAAHSSVGDGMIPTEFVIEKMAAAWAEKRAASFSASTFGKGVTAGDDGLRRMTPEEVQQHEAQAEELTEASFRGLHLRPGIDVGVEAPGLDPRLVSAVKGGLAGTVAGTLGGIGTGLALRASPAAKFAVPAMGAAGAVGGALLGWRRGARGVEGLGEKTASDLEKLGSAAYDELGEAHMEKLAAGVIDGSVAWDELTDMEKVAVGWMGKALGGLKKGWNFMAQGKNVSLPTAPKGPGRLRRGWDAVTQGRTVKQPSVAGEAMADVRKLRAQDPGGGARKMPGGSGAPPPPAPKHTQGTGTQATTRNKSSTLRPGQAGPAGQAPDLPVPPASPAGERKPWMKARTKLMIGGTAALGGGTYLGGKALDTGSAFLTPQPPGTAYQYGGGAPSHFMNPQMGM